MSRRKANSGWLAGSESRVLSDISAEGVFNDLFPIIEGTTLREGELEALAGERADYFIERLLIWGVGFYETITPLTRTDSRMVVRVGTADQANAEDIAESTLLMTVDNMELWSRILLDDQIGCYTASRWAFDGASLVSDESLVADRFKSIFPTVGPNHFMIDIQQRFSLQREEDNLYVAFGPDEQFFQENDTYVLQYTWKALVKEYRK